MSDIDQKKQQNRRVVKPLSKKTINRMVIHTPRPPSKPREVWEIRMSGVEECEREKNATNSSAYSIDTESSGSSFSSSQLDNLFADDFKLVREDKSAKVGDDKVGASNAAVAAVDWGDLLFESVCSEIRAMNVLSSYQMHYVGTLSKDKLCKIIELYNVVIRNVNEIL
jgi:hypothetical protein